MASTTAAQQARKVIITIAPTGGDGD